MTLESLKVIVKMDKTLDRAKLNGFQSLSRATTPMLVVKNASVDAICEYSGLLKDTLFFKNKDTVLGIMITDIILNKRTGISDFDIDVSLNGNFLLSPTANGA